MQANGRSLSAATAATIACVPSPPAAASASAPAAISARTSCRRSSSRCSSIGLIPRSSASSASPAASAFPSPDFGFQNITALAGGGAGESFEPARKAPRASQIPAPHSAIVARSATSSIVPSRSTIVAAARATALASSKIRLTPRLITPSSASRQAANSSTAATMWVGKLFSVASTAVTAPRVNRTSAAIALLRDPWLLIGRAVVICSRRVRASGQLRGWDSNPQPND